MTMNAQEQLSALLDGELPEAEVPMAVRRMARDPGLRDATLRYSLIGDALRNELPPGRPAALVERVRAELGDTPAPAASRAPWRFGRMAGGFAVAASQLGAQLAVTRWTARADLVDQPQQTAGVAQRERHVVARFGAQVTVSPAV